MRVLRLFLAALLAQASLSAILPLEGTCSTQLNMCEGSGDDSGSSLGAAQAMFPRGPRAARRAAGSDPFRPPLIVPLRNASLASATRVTRRTSRSAAQAVVPPVNPSVDLSAAADPLTGAVMVVSGNEGEWCAVLRACWACGCRVPALPSPPSLCFAAAFLSLPRRAAHPPPPALPLYFFTPFCCSHG